MNTILIAGHLGADPEVRFTQSGKKVTTLRVATSSRKGSNAEETIWWRVSIWGDEQDKMISFLKKGSAIMIVGELNKPAIFNDREGKPQISLDITAHHLSFSPFGKGGSSSSAEQQSTPSQSHGSAPFGSHPGEAPSSPYASAGATFDDEVPF